MKRRQCGRTTWAGAGSFWSRRSAGFLGALVRTEFWQSLVLTGHEFLTSLENVVNGAFLAIISVVCPVILAHNLVQIAALSPRNPTSGTPAPQATRHRERLALPPTTTDYFRSK